MYYSGINHLNQWSVSIFQPLYVLWIDPITTLPLCVCDASRKLFIPSGQWKRQNTNDPLMLHLLSNKYFSVFTGCAHDSMSGSLLPSFFLVLDNSEMGQSMLLKSFSDDGLVIQSTHWSTFWVRHIYSSEITEDSLPSQSILITTCMDFIKIPPKDSYNGIPTVVIKATNRSGSQAPCMMPVLPFFVGPPIFFFSTSLRVLMVCAY